ncbi:MAG: proton-conducting transporter membrane subunit [Solirubrobacteraceae bacterium]
MSALAAQRLGVGVAVVASVALASAGLVAVFVEQLVWQPFLWFPFGRGGVHVDQLPGLFLILTGLVSAPLFIAQTQGPRISLVLRPLLVLCVVGVIVVDNVFEFLIVYELTVVLIYALISVRSEDPRARRAAALTLSLGKLGGGAVLAGMVLLAAVKAALIPLQTWLPGAYAGADADSSGFVAAVSLNVAFYAMLRVWFGFLGHPAVWWAVVALLVGALTALIGILGGILQRELRLFVAYSSIENAGLIVADLGLALMGKAQHQAGLVGLGLIAGLAALAFVRAIGMTFLGMPARSIDQAAGRARLRARRHGIPRCA